MSGAIVSPRALVGSEGLWWGGGSSRGSNRGNPANTQINATTGGWGGRQAKARNVAKVPQNLDAQFFDRLIQNISHTIAKGWGVGERWWRRGANTRACGGDICDAHGEGHCAEDQLPATVFQ